MCEALAGGSGDCRDNDRTNQALSALIMAIRFPTPPPKTLQEPLRAERGDMIDGEAIAR
jgi:hypothetical protein